MVFIKKNPANDESEALSRYRFTIENCSFLILTESPQPTPASLGVFTISIAILALVKISANLTVCARERNDIIT